VFLKINVLLEGRPSVIRDSAHYLIEVQDISLTVTFSLEFLER